MAGVDMLQRGWEARRNEQPERAHEMFMQALRHCRRTHDRHGEAESLLALADNAYHWLPSPAGTPVNPDRKRQGYARRAMEIFFVLGDLAGQCRAMLTLSTTQRGKLGEQTCARVVSVAQDIGDSRLHAEALLTYVALRGAGPDTRGLIEEARESARKACDKYLLARTEWHLALSPGLSIAEQIGAFQRCFSLLRESGRDADLVRVILSYDWVIGSSGGRDARLELLKEAYSLAQNLPNDALKQLCESALGEGKANPVRP